MNNNGPKFTIGIEEEYLLVDQDTRALIIDPPVEFRSGGRYGGSDSEGRWDHCGRWDSEIDRARCVKDMKTIRLNDRK